MQPNDALRVVWKLEFPFQKKKKKSLMMQRRVFLNKYHISHHVEMPVFYENSRDHSIIKHFQSPRAIWSTLTMSKHWKKWTESMDSWHNQNLAKTETFDLNISCGKNVILGNLQLTWVILFSESSTTQQIKGETDLEVMFPSDHISTSEVTHIHIYYNFQSSCQK